MGNCGVGFAPAQLERQEWLIQLMEGVEDIQGAALLEGKAHDLPTGAARLIQRIEGYDYTVCGGQVTFEASKATDARPGRLFRGAQAAPRRR